MAISLNGLELHGNFFFLLLFAFIFGNFLERYLWKLFVDFKKRNLKFEYVKFENALKNSFWVEMCDTIQGWCYWEYSVLNTDNFTSLIDVLTNEIEQQQVVKKIITVRDIRLTKLSEKWHHIEDLVCKSTLKEKKNCFKFSRSLTSILSMNLCQFTFFCTFYHYFESYHFQHKNINSSI